MFLVMKAGIKKYFVLFRMVALFLIFTVLFSCTSPLTPDGSGTNWYFFSSATFDKEGGVLFVRDKASNWSDNGLNRASFTKELFSTNVEKSTTQSMVTLQVPNPPYFTELLCLTISNNVTVVTGKTSEKQEEVRLYDTLGNKFKTFNLSSTANIIDLSPDNSKFSVSTETNFILFDNQGVLIKSLDQGGYFVWKSNSEGYFYNSQTNKLSLYDIDSDAYSDLSFDIKPFRYNSKSDILFSVENGIFKELNLKTSAINQDNLFEKVPNISQTYRSISINPDGKYILFSGGFLLNRNNYSYIDFLPGYQEVF